MATRENTNWKQYSIEPSWFAHRDIDYQNSPFNDAVSLNYWQQVGFANTKFTGDMYDMRRTAPEWMDSVLLHFAHWKHASWSIYRMSPGTCLPRHSDKYVKFKKIHNLSEKDTITRAIIFLEDWASGHYFEIGTTPIVNWQAGDVVEWTNTVPHLASNMGYTNRYTLQITGLQD